MCFYRAVLNIYMAKCQPRNSNELRCLNRFIFHLLPPANADKNKADPKIKPDISTITILISYIIKLLHKIRDKPR